MSGRPIRMGFAPLTADEVQQALARFDREHSNVLGERALFTRRRLAETPPWHWAFDALIHLRRGNLLLAQASWRRAMRLSMPEGGAK